jgi:acid phosphatase type 7
MRTTTRAAAVLFAALLAVASAPTPCAALARASRGATAALSPRSPTTSTISKKKPRPLPVPSGVHIALGANDDEMTITWQTSSSAGSVVQYAPFGGGNEELVLSATGEERAFVDGGNASGTRFIHHATLRELRPGEKIAYRVGDPVSRAWSERFWFFHKRSPEQIRAGPPLRMIAVCDVGHSDSTGVLDLVRAEVHGVDGADADVAEARPDLLVHCGDFAYDLDSRDGRTGDRYMDDIQPIAAYVPYMVSPGNHERAYNFSHYKARFRMPGVGAETETQNHYYSLDIGPVHLVAWNSEVFFWGEYFDAAYVNKMYDWLEADLAAANANRAKTPWIVVHGHRPMYCAKATKGYAYAAEEESRRGGWFTRAITSGKRALGLGKKHNHADDKPTCSWTNEAVRRGIPSWCEDEYRDGALGACGAREATEFLGEASASASASESQRSIFPIEELFYDHGVDLHFNGHEHDYVRYYPAYRDEVAGGENVTFERYVNPHATVHITTGSGGNDEMDSGAKFPNPPSRGRCTHDDAAAWCAFQSGWGPKKKSGRSADFTYGVVSVDGDGTSLEWRQYSAYDKGLEIDRFRIETSAHGPFKDRIRRGGGRRSTRRRVPETSSSQPGTRERGEAARRRSRSIPQHAL